MVASRLKEEENEEYQVDQDVQGVIQRLVMRDLSLMQVCLEE